MRVQMVFVLSYTFYQNEKELCMNRPVHCTVGRQTNVQIHFPLTQVSWLPFIAVIKHHGQKQLIEGAIYFGSWFQRTIMVGRNGNKKQAWDREGSWEGSRESRLEVGCNCELWEPNPVMYFLPQGFTTYPNSATNGETYISLWGRLFFKPACQGESVAWSELQEPWAQVDCIWTPSHYGLTLLNRVYLT